MAAANTRNIPTPSPAPPPEEQPIASVSPPAPPEQPFVPSRLSQQEAGRDAPATMLVLDTTATDPDRPRVHEMMVNGRLRQYVFHNNKPLALEQSVALKFLRHEAFQLVDESNEIIPFERRPKQPSELGAGEKFELRVDQCVANLNELTPTALYMRAIELPGGEAFKVMGDRQSMIDFLIKHTVETREKNTSKATDDDPAVRDRAA